MAASSPKQKSKSGKTPNKAGDSSLKAGQGDRKTDRRLKISPYKSFSLQKRVKIQRPPLPSGFRLLRNAFGVIFGNWKLMLGIVALYTIFNVVLVQGIGGLNVAQTKSMISQTFTGQYAHLAVGLTTFAYLLGSANATPSSTGTGVVPTATGSGPYQFILFIVASLAVIWTLRQVYAKAEVRIRDAYYQGMTPTIPFILVLAVIGLQLIPLLIGTLLYTAVIVNGIAALAFEKMVWIVVLLLFAVISLYMLCSSIFALYIVTLPDMTPMRALRAARQLVVGRRWIIMRKLLFLPLALLVLLAIIIVPLIMFAAPLASWVFVLLSMIAIAAAHSYIYALYRELL